MAQLTFTQTLKLLYFDVNIDSASADSVINSFQEKNKLMQQDKVVLSKSLMTNLAMHTDKEAKMKTYVFKMLKSPLVNKKIDSGYIRIRVGEADNKKKILNLEWCVQLDNKVEAEAWFEELKILFIPISTKHHFEDDEELEYAKYAEFSTRQKSEKGIRDITIFLSKTKDTGGYEIRIFPYNEFME